MSWFETVVNTVNTVSKSFNTALAYIINPTSAANPFQDKLKGKPNKSTYCESDENENGNGNEEHESGGEGSSQSPANVSRNRIASRARYSYQLDRFKKNAMLLFLQTVSDPQNGCRNKINMDAKKMVDTFNTFRFEVDVHEDLTCAEVDSKCQEFFQRDFRHYGAVMVVVMSFDGTNGKIAAYDGLFSEQVILRHLTDDLNPSLLNKPKIYITETNRSGALFFMGRRFQYSLPIQEHHRDVLLLHIPMLDYGSVPVRRGAITLICDNINKMADTKDFVTIIEKSIEHAAIENSMFAADFLPISFSHSFSKEMVLFSQVPE